MKDVDYVGLRTEDVNNLRRSRVCLRDTTGESSCTLQLVLNTKGGIMRKMTDEDQKVAITVLHHYLATAAYIFQDIDERDLRPHAVNLLYSRALEPNSITTMYNEDVLAERILSRLERKPRTKPDVERPPSEKKVRKLTNAIRWRHCRYRLQSSVWCDLRTSGLISTKNPQLNCKQSSKKASKNFGGTLTELCRVLSRTALWGHVVSSYP